jgi:hypothetical protein
MADKLTPSDREALTMMPAEWFNPLNLPHMVKNPEWRCQRLHKAGALGRRFVGEYPTTRVEYMKRAHGVKEGE